MTCRDFFPHADIFKKCPQNFPLKSDEDPFLKLHWRRLRRKGCPIMSSKVVGALTATSFSNECDPCQKKPFQIVFGVSRRMRAMFLKATLLDESYIKSIAKMQLSLLENLIPLLQKISWKYWRGEKEKFRSQENTRPASSRVCMCLLNECLLLLCWGDIIFNLIFSTKNENTFALASTSLPGLCSGCNNMIIFHSNPLTIVCIWA